MSFDLLSWKDYITLGAAALGAGLGVMNTWNTINQRRVRLKVRPAFAIGVPLGQEMFSIEVVNLSAFPLIICEVGFTLDGRSLGNGERAAMPLPLLPDRGDWPRRLQPRETVSTLLDPAQIQWRRVGRAYARTACGEAAYGSSPALTSRRNRGLMQT